MHCHFVPVISLLCLSLIVPVVLSAENDVTELDVKTLHKPDECKREARRGDMLTMHYRGTLSDGTEFDSR
jgi:FK506-binding protein 2